MERKVLNGKEGLAVRPTTPVGSRMARVLIVDDYEDARESLCMLLTLLGHPCAAAPNAPTALKTAADFRPDVVVMDIALPGVDGYETARLLRGLPGLSTVQFIAMTGYGQERDVRRSQDAGFAAHLTKPADPAELQKMLQQFPFTPPRPVI